MHESTQRLCRSTRRIQRGIIIRQQVQGEEEFSGEAQSRDCVQQEVSCALDKGNKRGPFQCMQGWKDELLQKHQIKGVRPPMMKGEDTKESWCGWSC